MTLSFIAPSALVRGIPFILRLLVMPATTTLSNSSKRTRAGRFFISNVSVNCTFASTISPGSTTLPRLVFLVVPQLFHLRLLNLVEELIILVPFLQYPEGGNHMLDELIICLPGIFP